MPFRRIDIHAHLNSPDFDVDRDAVIQRSLDGGTAIINVGTCLADSKLAIEIAEKHPEGVYAIVGLHPTDTDEAFDLEAYRALAKHPKSVGIGECGLDYFRMKGDTKAAQRATFEAQITLAQECGKPLMLHVRDAYDEALDILAQHPGARGDAHFFAGTTAQARRFLDIGFTLSFTGVITFAREYTELIEYVPLDMIQAETDCPFVAPMPYRGKRNEPSYLPFIIDKIARIKKLTIEETELALYENARRVWGI